MRDNDYFEDNRIEEGIDHLIRLGFMLGARGSSRKFRVCEVSIIWVFLFLNKIF